MASLAPSGQGDSGIGSAKGSGAGSGVGSGAGSAIALPAAVSGARCAGAGVGSARIDALAAWSWGRGSPPHPAVRQAMTMLRARTS